MEVLIVYTYMQNVPRETFVCPPCPERRKAFRPRHCETSAHTGRGNPSPPSPDFCRDEPRSSGSPQANDRPQGDPRHPLGRRDLPPANCIRPECRTAHPAGIPIKGTGEPPLRRKHMETHVGALIERPVRRRRTIAPRAIHGTRSVNGICLRQIAFVPNAGQALLVPTPLSHPDP